MIRKFYRWFHRATSGSQEAGEYSAGYWPDKLRFAAVRLCGEKTGRLLEVGCGEGLFLTRLGLANNSISIFGIDNNPAMLDRARERIRGKGLGNIELFKGDALSLPFEDCYFDAVVCVNVLFNMPSKDLIIKSLHEMGRVCKKKGRVIFDFRNGQNPAVNLKYALASIYDPTTRGLGLVTWRMDEAEAVLKDMAFEIKNRPYVSFPKGRFTPVVLIEAEKRA